MHCVGMWFWLKPQINYSLNLGQDVSTLENNSVVATMSCFHLCDRCCISALARAPLNFQVQMRSSSASASSLLDLSAADVRWLVQYLLYKTTNGCLASAHSRS